MRHHDTSYRRRHRCHITKRQAPFRVPAAKTNYSQIERIVFLRIGFLSVVNAPRDQKKQTFPQDENAEIRKLKHGGNRRLCCGNTAATFCFRYRIHYGFSCFRRYVHNRTGALFNNVSDRFRFQESRISAIVIVSLCCGNVKFRAGNLLFCSFFQQKREDTVRQLVGFFFPCSRPFRLPLLRKYLQKFHICGNQVFQLEFFLILS